MLIHFVKLEPSCLLQWSLVPLPSYRQNLLHPVSQMETSHFHIPRNLNCSVYSFSGGIGTISPMCFELSARASMVKAIYYCCKSGVWKTLTGTLENTFYRTLTISFLTILPLSLYASLFLPVMSVPWRVAKLLGLGGILLLLHLLEGVG